MVKKRDEVEIAVEEVLEEIDGHEFCGGGVPRSTTVAFLQRIVSGLQSRVKELKEEMKEVVFDDDEVEPEEDEEEL